ncbi:DUF5133 domain-containing protein [Streptomyces sp. NBC_00847]|uniref:DUF5133 domain-containing protein n=1 Tax=unclassified Streptomyces TaxID=2593676 RepID=UPI0022518652|nr:DUF5133 domain-containing protein [Streptomyces sp. NBC_00847]MCX4878483.1 DUF5133 domain-containing protein [Streptomyces sp. NBC_00847]
MLMPHPAVLRRLVEEYESVQAEEAEQSGGRMSPRAQDLAYTLCVSTGTRDVRRALEAAHRLLAATTTLQAPPETTEIGVG